MRALHLSKNLTLDLFYVEKVSSKISHIFLALFLLQDPRLVCSHPFCFSAVTLPFSSFFHILCFVIKSSIKSFLLGAFPLSFQRPPQGDGDPSEDSISLK